VRQLLIGLAALVGVTAQGAGWVEGQGGLGDAPASLPGQNTIGATAAIDYIQGSLGADDVDIYKITVTSPGTFTATTVNVSGGDTTLAIFNTAGNGVSFSDDFGITIQSRLTGTFVSAPGTYYLAVGAYGRRAVNSINQNIWNELPHNTERAPDGPGAPGPLAGFAGNSPALQYRVNFTGVGFGTTATAPAIPANLWFEATDAGDLPNTGQVTAGSGPLNLIYGSLAATDVDMYKIVVTDPANFNASTNNGTPTDTELYLFDENGVGIVFNEDAPSSGGSLQSTLTNAFVSAPGTYYLAISRYYSPAQKTGSGSIWNEEPYDVERAPDGPGAPGPIDSWIIHTDLNEAYAITLMGVGYAQAATVTIAPNNFAVAPGALVSGGLAELGISDDAYLVMRPGVVLTSSQDPIALRVDGTVLGANPSELKIVVETKASAPSIRQITEVWNFNTNGWQVVDTNPAISNAGPDTVLNVTLTPPANYVGPANLVQMRLKFKAMGAILVYPWQARVDEATWRYKD
jgi:hypothetical protein